MPQRGTDSWNGSGVVYSDVLFAETRSGNRACSFRLAIDKKNKSRVIVRINAYGGNTVVIERRQMKRGDYCIIAGELMNRVGNGEDLTEIRCEEIVIISQSELRR